MLVLRCSPSWRCEQRRPRLPSSQPPALEALSSLAASPPGPSITSARPCLFTRCAAAAAPERPEVFMRRPSVKERLFKLGPALSFGSPGSVAGVGVEGRDVDSYCHRRVNRGREAAECCEHWRRDKGVRSHSSHSSETQDLMLTCPPPANMTHEVFFTGAQVAGERWSDWSRA